MRRQDVLRDALASIVVFLVALPLCMGVAIASGMSPAAGLITGIIGGLVVGPIQSPALQVSGPTATLAVTVLALVQTRGLEVIGPVVLLSGLLQIVAGLLRSGRWFRIIPPAVVHGMLAGIGILIAASQLHLVVDDSPKQSGLQNLLSVPQAIWKGLVPLDGSSHHLAATVGVVTVLLLAVWAFVVPKRWRAIPAPLVAVLGGTAIATLWSLPIRYVSLPANLFEAVSPLSLGGLRLLLDPSLWIAAATIALIGSAETLLSASAVDRIVPGSRSNLDRGLLTQGIGNVLCGLCGVPPMTGVIVRSTANVEAGARTRLSVVLHATWLLGFAALLPTMLARIPIACLAAILVFTGYRLINLENIRTLRRFGSLEVAVYAVTVVGIVTTDLLTGVAIGFALALGKLLYRLTHLVIRIEGAPGSRARTMRLSGSATFLRLTELAGALEALPSDTELHVLCDELDYLDHACLELLRTWASEHRARGGEVVIEWALLRGRSEAPAPVSSRRARRPAVDSEVGPTLGEPVH